MDTFRKWLNKPKADDKSLLARFYHADRSLTAVASELDSFDGRAEPDRCSRLVSRLRQGQDKVLSITNQIMEELLGEDRDPRAFRAKFPEEVLQENLAGQLWFGAECLAAGSSIMNREQESKEMRPLAQAVTKSLGNVRNLLRDQCLRNNVPNSKTLHLDFNDSTTEQLYESLKIFDRLFAEFELRYVSAMVQVKTKHEYEMQEYICVLFSETLQRALTLGLLEQDKVDSFDPALMFSIPRLAIICGLVIYPNGPLNMDMPADQLSEMFRPFRTILVKIRDLLRALNSKELYQLEKLLCTNEEINLKEAQENSVEQTHEKDITDIRNNNNSTNAVMKSEKLASACSQSGPKEFVTPEASDGLQADESFPTTSNIERKVNFHNDSEFSVYISSSSVSSSEESTPSLSPTPSPTPSGSIASSEPSSASTSALSSPDWTDEENNRLVKELDIVSADCATGYLIPNTNLGNLLQPNEVPLTDNFIASEDDEFGSCNEQSHLEVNQNTLSHHDGIISSSSEPSCSHIFGLESSEESEQLTIKASAKSLDSNDSILNSHYAKLEKGSSSGSSDVASVAQRRTHHHNCQHPYNTHRHHHHHSHQLHSSPVSANSGGSSNSSPISQNAKNETRRPHRPYHTSHKKRTCRDDEMCQEGVKNTQETVHHSEASSGDTSSSLSDGEPNEVNLALREVGRMKFKSTENLLHRLFVCIAGVADQLQTNFASDLRQILRSVFLMNMSPPHIDITIPEKTKDSELFEFRASENDVIQESAGSNQSIYSAEEVNPELDNVFNSSSSGSSNSGVGNDGGECAGEIRTGTGTTGIRRGNTIDLGTVATSNVINTRGNIGRSRSLGDQESSVLPSNPPSTSTRLLSSYVRGRHLSTSHRNSNMCDIKDNHSIGSNSPDNSSTSNSPVSDRSVNAQFSHNSHIDSIAVSQSLHEDQNHLDEHHKDDRQNQHNQQYFHHRHHNNHHHHNHHHHRHHPRNTAVANHNFNSNSNGNSNNNSNSSSNSGSINNNEIDRESRTQAASPPNQQPLHQSSLLRLSPPAWIPDDKAPRCMSCTTPFTAFRRRHHCRNCGGVFCGVCSSTSTPLPKYGLTKAVRVCRECFVHQLTATATATAAT